jgi:hypothetical protein
MKLSIPLVLALSLASCTPQARSAVDEIVQISVEACKEVPNFVPPASQAGAVVGLICTAVDAGAPAVEVVINSDLWNQMKAQYLKDHGALPDGVSNPSGPLGAK